MKEQDKLYPSKTKKNIVFLKFYSIVTTTIVAIIVPSAVALVGMLMFGNLVKRLVLTHHVYLMLFK